MQSCIRGSNKPVTPKLSQLHAKGAVLTQIEGLVLPEEIEHLKNIGDTQGLRPSQTVSGSASSIVSEARTSRSAFLPKGNDKVVECIEERLATVAGQARTHLEPLQITDYTHKQQFKQHHDYFNAGEGMPERTTTIFTYLEDSGVSDGACGGATCFHQLEGLDAPLCVFPKRGNALMWSNRKPNGEVNPATLHSGEPITCAGAHKVGLNAWFRDQPYAP